ncbi:MAG: hypothetical protein FD174_1130 [Geobacteraceae bacterium]|nr:MAG: hypothetical protein FD174_1130 [Geobacteraceae bacterium]
MPYRYLEDIALADAAFEAWGTTVEEMFIAAADATMNVMVEELATIHRDREIRLEVEHDALDILLFKFLNELIFYKDAERLLLRVESVTITRHPSLFTLHSVACGEELNPARHALSADVKAVTLHRFKVEQTEEGWKATVILDI